jgi:chemotaxis signal transduction protein
MSRISRRIANRRAEPLQKLIAFQIQQQWFALPIQLAQKVIPLGLVYGAPMGGLSLTRYQNLEIPVIDAAVRVFGVADVKPLASQKDEASPRSNHPSPPEDAADQRHLLIVLDAQAQPMGIPLDAPPSLRRAPRSAFAPVPAAYLATGNIRCVNALIHLAEDEPPLFLLDLGQLLERSLSGVEGMAVPLAGSSAEIKALPQLGGMGGI